MIFTSYYAKVKNLPIDKYVFVQVSNTVPSWFKYPVVKLSGVYPDWYLVHGLKDGGITEEQYTHNYILQLNARVSKDDVVRYLKELDSYGKDVLLLCYETSDKFCHRKPLAEWLDMGIEELH